MTPVSVHVEINKNPHKLGPSGGKESWIPGWVLGTWMLSGQDVLGFEILPHTGLLGLLWHGPECQFLGIGYWNLVIFYWTLGGVVLVFHNRNKASP